MRAMHAENRKKRLPNLYYGASAKSCCECRKTKPVSEFTCRRKEPDGLTRQCRDCIKTRREEWVSKNIDRVRATNLTASQKYAAKYPERIEEARIRCQYGIGFAEYDAMLEAQGGCCAVCGAPPLVRPHGKRAILCIDHDHTTGKVRGLLCRLCNHGIGSFADNPALLENAATYLRGHLGK